MFFVVLFLVLLVESMSQPAIQIKAVTKRFGHFTALHSVDAEVPSGGALCLLGPNGAGKTTLLRMIAALSRPTSGSVHVEGIDLSKQAELIRRRLGVISHQTMLYDDLTARENLRFYGDLYGIDNVENRIDCVLEEVGLTGRDDDLFRTFSRGMKQRLAIARAVLHEPSILLLDEPFTGLDTAARDMLAARILGFREEGRTIVLVTHDLTQALALGDEFILLARGRVMRQDKTSEVTINDLESLYRTTVDHDAALEVSS